MEVLNRRIISPIYKHTKGKKSVRLLKGKISTNKFKAAPR